METLPEIKLPHKKIKAIANDPVKSATAVNLIYVSDSEPGIVRRKKQKGFIYLLGNQPLSDKEELERIKKLVIPPAWNNVWICKHHNGHIQCTGVDALKRKQYRYHPQWNYVRNQTKFYRMLDFGEHLPQLRLQIEKDIAGKELTEEKVIAAVISVMERTYIRIGSNAYEKLYGSFGLTTLKDKHVKINGDTLNFSFKGKKGINHNITIKNKKLARIVKQCRDIPGQELFQYKDSNGNYHSVDSGKVNSYIKSVTEKDFTAKDFRTWAGSINALRAFKQIGEAATNTDTKKKIVEALDYVSNRLGNTRTVCKKYYVHPLILEMYETKSLNAYLAELDDIEKNDNKSDLTHEEKILLKILQSK